MGGEGEGKVVCVTGASGYVASWLVKLLLERGYTVRATVRNLSDPGKTKHLEALEGGKERLELFEGDLMEEGSFDSVIDGCDGVFHTASPVIVASANPQEEIIEPAVKGSVNVLRSCSKAASVRRVVLTSSTAAVMYNFNSFGPGVFVDETWVSDHDFCQQNELWYCLSKTLAEEASWKFAQENGIDLVVMNPGLVIGPLLQPTLNTTSQFQVDVIKGKSLLPHYQLVDVRDVAYAHVMGFEKHSASGRYILVAKSMTHRQLLHLLHKLYPTSIHAPTNGGGDDGIGEVSRKKAESLGVSFMDVEVSLKDSIESLKEKNFLNF
ncbi:Rossmann-fold superfamily protein [Perilla frutescens var. hirtella]|uniref:Dihydroflavonol 4-reductase n=1 Tax=Perilla frutescens var. hirtella TaxID=608512 RepID=A0AAD4J000_PERFH|nr:Rossmann-fold superfamily protein [Perilla frutescens var. hirtella]